MTEDDLKPCPKCGSDGALVLFDPYDTCWVQCLNDPTGEGDECGFCGPEFDVEDDQAAFRAWNDLPRSPAPETTDGNGL